MRQRFRTAQGKALSLYDAGLVDKTVDVFRRLAELIATSPALAPDKGMALIARATEGLIFCAEETLNLQKVSGNPAADARRVACIQMDPDRLPLSALPELVERFAMQPFGKLVAYCVRHCAVGQHFRVSSALQATTGDGKNRFRLVEADDGLRRMYETDAVPEVGTGLDRLARSLDLLEQCAVVARTNDRYCITPNAKPFLS